LLARAALQRGAATIPALETIIDTCRPPRSAANPGSRLPWPSAQRNSIATLRPSSKPGSARPRRDAATKGDHLRTPRLADSPNGPSRLLPLCGV